MAHLRAEYQGRGDRSERQQTLNAYLSELKKLAQAFKVAVVVTNQVMAIPDQFSLGGPQVKSCGGPVMARDENEREMTQRRRGAVASTPRGGRVDAAGRSRRRRGEVAVTSATRIGAGAPQWLAQVMAHNTNVKIFLKKAG